MRNVVILCALYGALSQLAGCTNEDEPELLSLGCAHGGGKTDLDTLMINATFRILGPSIEVPGALYTGSGFLVSRSSAGDPARSFVAVSAAHVMSGISGNHAVFVVRMGTTKRGISERSFRSGSGWMVVLCGPSTTPRMS